MLTIKNRKLKKRRSTLATFALISFEMGITIFIFSRIGKWIDSYYNLEKTFILIMSLVGFAIAFFVVYKHKLSSLMYSAPAAASIPGYSVGTLYVSRSSVLMNDDKSFCFKRFQIEKKVRENNPHLSLVLFLCGVVRYRNLWV